MSEVTEALPADKVLSRISLVVFRQGTKPPANPERYCQQIVHDRYGEPGPSIHEWRVVGNPDAPSASEAVARYSRLSESEQLPDFGRPTGEFEGTGPDGNQIAVLFFLYAPRRAGAEQSGFAKKEWWEFWK